MNTALPVDFKEINYEEGKGTEKAIITIKTSDQDIKEMSEECLALKIDHTDKKSLAESYALIKANSWKLVKVRTTINKMVKILIKPSMDKIEAIKAGANRVITQCAPIETYLKKVQSDEDDRLAEEERLAEEKRLKAEQDARDALIREEAEEKRLLEEKAKKEAEAELKASEEKLEKERLEKEELEKKNKELEEELAALRAPVAKSDDKKEEKATDERGPTNEMVESLETTSNDTVGQSWEQPEPFVSKDEPELGVTNTGDGSEVIPPIVKKGDEQLPENAGRENEFAECPVWKVDTFVPNHEFILIPKHRSVCYENRDSQGNLTGHSFVAITGNVENETAHKNAVLISAAPDLQSVAYQAYLFIKGAEINEASLLEELSRALTKSGYGQKWE